MKLFLFFCFQISHIYHIFDLSGNYCAIPMTSQNYAKLIISVWCDEIISSWLIICTYKTKTIKYTAKNMYEEKSTK